MPGRKHLFTGVGEGVTKITNEATWANVEIPGTGAHASNALKRAGWDGKTPMAAVMMTADSTGLKGTQHYFGCRFKAKGTQKVPLVPQHTTIYPAIIELRYH